MTLRTGLKMFDRAYNDLDRYGDWKAWSVKDTAVALGEVIRRARYLRRLPQTVVAPRGGFTQSESSALECGRGDMQVVTLIRIAYALGMSPGELIDRAIQDPRLSPSRLSGVTCYD